MKFFHQPRRGGHKANDIWFKDPYKARRVIGLPQCGGTSVIRHPASKQLHWHNTS
jgi:hypothetical protein